MTNRESGKKSAMPGPFNIVVDTLLQLIEMNELLLDTPDIVFHVPFVLLNARDDFGIVATELFQGIL
jgi:hypothetical protein